MMRFHDREEAGRKLAAELRSYAQAHPIVLALPRGGVPVGYEVARALSAELDVWVVRKLGVPWHPELGVGAVAEGGYTYVAHEVLSHVGLSAAQLADLARSKRREVEERVHKFRGDRLPPVLQNRIVIVVDDGIATGGTIRAAIRSIRAQRPKELVLAVPVAASQTVAELTPEVDRIVCLLAPSDLYAIGLWYEDFSQVSDDEVVQLLDRARRQMEGAPAQEVEKMGTDADQGTLLIPAGAVQLEGDLVIPDGAKGLVLFAHGSGSSRKSSRNRSVAQALRKRGLATLLFDLLTAEEERVDAIDAHLRFDIPLLAERLGRVTDWMRSNESAAKLSFGYFGASTGAAAALIAAAERPGEIGAVVSRGGRPDLARDALARVRAPTLLIVGEADKTVLALNREALERIAPPKELTIVPGATHLFEEPGTLGQVAQLAADWFARHLGAQSQPEATALR